MCTSIGKNRSNPKPTNQPTQKKKKQNSNNTPLPQLKIKHTISLTTFLLFYDLEKQQNKMDAVEMSLMNMQRAHCVPFINCPDPEYMYTSYFLYQECGGISVV